MKKKRLVYINGDYVTEQEAKISIFDSALMFGDMVFEMTRSLSNNVSLFDKKLSQSFLSLFEILSLNYVKVSTSCQFGLFDFVSLEKTQVS